MGCPFHSRTSGNVRIVLVGRWVSKENTPKISGNLQKSPEQFLISRIGINLLRVRLLRVESLCRSWDRMLSPGGFFVWRGMSGCICFLLIVLHSAIMSAHISRLGEKDREDNASSNIFGPESLGELWKAPKQPFLLFSLDPSPVCAGRMGKALSIRMGFTVKSIFSNKDRVNDRSLHPSRHESHF